MPADAPLTSPWAALDVLARALAASPFRLPHAARADRERSRVAVINDIRRHIGPRLRQPDGPLVVAVTGPTGAGTSAVVNLLADDDLSPVGVVRPTTTRPVVWVRSEDRGRWWFDLVGHLGGADAVVIAEGGGPDAAPVALIDVPSGTDAGTEAVMEAVSLADLCIFVSTANRYADAAATSMVAAMRERGLPLLFVMNRLPVDTWQRDELVRGYVESLERFGLAGSLDPRTVFAGSTGPPGVTRVPGLERLQLELDALEDGAFRRDLLLGSVASRVDAIAHLSRSLAEALDSERAAIKAYQVVAREAYRRQVAKFASDLESGAFGLLSEHGTWGEAAVDLAGMMTRRAGVAAEDAAEAWSEDEVGARLISEGGGSLRRHGSETAFEAQGHLEGWFQELGDLAASATGRARVSRRRRRKLAEGVWRRVLDGDRSLSRSAQRAFRDPGAVVDGGRELLVAAADAALESDGARFQQHLGQPPEAAHIGQLVTATSMVESAAATAGDLDDFGRPAARSGEPSEVAPHPEPVVAGEAEGVDDA
jgi:hypothetical protein